MKNEEQGFAELDDVVFKQYLECLDTFPALKEKQPLHEIIRNTRLDAIQRIVYDTSEDNVQKLHTVFSTISSHNNPVFVVLRGNGQKTDIFMGTQSLNSRDAHTASEVLSRSMKGNFPGIETRPLFKDDLDDITNQILSDDTNYISAVSGIPGLKNSMKGNFVQGIEKIINGMQGKEYIALLIANPLNRAALDGIEAGYQNLYSSLSCLEVIQHTLSESQSLALGETLGTSISQAISKTTTRSNSTSTGHTVTNSSGTNESTSRTSDTLLSVGLPAFSQSKTTTRGSFESTSNAKSKTSTDGLSKSIGSTDTKGSNESQSKTLTTQQGISHQYTFKDRRITDYLNIIDEQLQRIRECKNSGMWEFGTYFIASMKSTSRIGADLMAGLLRGESSGVERNAILSWDLEPSNEKNFKNIRHSLACFQHPVFDTSSRYSFPTATATSLISTAELAIGMTLPQKSLPGIPVFESVEFGRTVSSFEPQKGRQIELGMIQHLGNNDTALKVSLDIDSLTAHTFVTGSTGSGKSNAIYSLVYDLWKMYNIPFLIIEPAKGEYKHVFGGYKGVKTFGTNIEKTALLRINPFSFPEGIHIAEHTDRLIEILNAVWPMYSAMPAILKAAIELVYERMGWNLVTSRNDNGRIFPDFTDLLEVLPEIINKSAYSAEIKGNYIGALVTRVESLTNGYFRSIFQKDELPHEQIFDNPCILDFSRVGSSETKALLMGIIFMKLQEHRLSATNCSNSGLQHITVMEEAHNLLRKTSMDQSSEGANLQGKAVEMMSNAIAEMRSYGEGFIIADQAPGLLDPSVIRNTNTKIILRLPDWDDRELVGRAANLKNEQIEELARLRTGCAAVYQNNWQEAVLCQSHKFDSKKEKPLQYSGDYTQLTDMRNSSKTALLKVLFLMKDQGIPFKEATESASIDSAILSQYFPEIVTTLTQGNAKKTRIDRYIKNLIHFEKAAIAASNDISDIELPKKRYLWAENLLKRIFATLEYEKTDQKFCEQIIQCAFQFAAEGNPELKDLWKIEMDKSFQWTYLL